MYTHEVLTADGRKFSIHYSEAEARVAADRIKGTVIQLTLNPSTYWDDTIGERYDH